MFTGFPYGIVIMVASRKRNVLTEISSDVSEPDVTFYPSSGHGRGKLDAWELDADLVIMTDEKPDQSDTKDDWFESFGGDSKQLFASPDDYRVEQRGDRYFCFFFEDNNEVFERIRDANLPITTFIGINDGCREGENYECVNSQQWLNKVFKRFPASGGRYITDHSPVIYPINHQHWNPHPPKPHQEFIFEDWNLKRGSDTRHRRYFGSYSRHMYGRELQYEVNRHNRSVWRWESETDMTVTLEHDNIANHCESIDGVVVSRRCKEELDELCDAIPQHRVIGGWHSVTEDEWYFTRRILRWAADNQLCTVGTIAYGQGAHEGILTALNKWTTEYPHQVRIFFFDEGDFQDIRSTFEYMRD